MIGKIALMIVLVALISYLPCSAEIVKLQKYSIDTGVYILPFNYTVQEPEIVGDIYYEGLKWDFGMNKRSMVIIAKCDLPTDPRALQYSLMVNSFCSKSTDWNNASMYRHLDEPYPGWLSVCRSMGNGSNTIVYAGSVDNETVMVLSTTEDPRTTVLILQNIRVIQPQNASNTSVPNRSRSPSVLKYLI